MKVTGHAFHGGYGTSRGVARIFAGIGWVVVGIGALICLAGFGALSSFGVIGVLAGIGMAISGALLVMLGQMLRANVDTADYARQTFALVLAQARGLPEVDLRKGAAEPGVSADSFAGATTASSDASP